MKKEVLFKAAMRPRVKRGIDIACDAIKTTIGAKGRNAFIDDPLQPKITNDGVTIAKAISLPDKFENMGAWLVKNTSSQTNDAAGDGTSTTAVLLQAIVDEALKRPESPMDIKRSLEAAAPKVVLAIKSQSKPCDDVRAVASISAESEELGNMIAEIMDKAGKNVPITIDDNKFGTNVEYSVTEGLETRNGYVHPYFANKEDGTATYEDVPVLVTDKKLTNLVEIEGLLKQLDEKKVSTLVFIVSDMEVSLLGNILKAKVAGQFNALVIKVYAQNDLEDMAAACGASLVSDAAGLKLADVRIEHLGKVKRIVSTDKKTLIVNDSPKSKEHATFLRAKAALEQNFYDKKSLITRAERLEGGVAVIRVGAPTDAEREYLKHKLEDAVNATKSALEEGLVEGGGMCLYRIAVKLKGKTVGEEILKEALKAPLKAILDNAGIDYASAVSRIDKKRGIDVRKGRAVNMFEKGIVDPAKVTRCAFENALSSAATFVTAEVAIADLPEEKK
jgi:chaperonin GroEL